MYIHVFEYSHYVPVATKKLVTVVASEGETGGLAIKWEGLFIDFQGRAIHCMTFHPVWNFYYIHVLRVTLKKKKKKSWQRTILPSHPQGNWMGLKATVREEEIFLYSSTFFWLI